MNLIDRIASALDNPRLKINPGTFEDCATDLLQGTYPNIVPIRGGSDSGRDADCLQAPGVPPVRMAITSSRTYEGARKNLRSSMKSLTDHGITGATIISVSLAELNQAKRKKLETLASETGYTLEAIIDRAFFADRLRKNGDWREKLLSLPGGPFSLSKYSIRGDVSRHEFKLIGRREELEAIDSIPNDLILHGVPGVGKSALLENIPQLYFVDGIPMIDRLMDDVLSTEPRILVVDDAPRRMSVLEDLQRIRRQECLSFRIIGVCWPHEIELLRTNMSQSVEMEVLPLIRSDIGTIVRDAGITRESLISKILDQSQGRPAWASRLIYLLKNDAEWQKVHTGEAIRGEVSQYLTRSGLSKDAKGLLAIISILGSIADSEIGALSKQLDIPRLAVAQLIGDLAVGGLFDVRQQWTHHASSENVYRVAPEILATSVVIETFFGAAPVPMTIAELFDSWPTKRIAVTLHCITAALMGNQSAQPSARSLFSDLLEKNEVEVGSDVYRYYLHLGINEARVIIQESIEAWKRSVGDLAVRRDALQEYIAIYFADILRDMAFMPIIDDALDFSTSIGDSEAIRNFLSVLVTEIRNAGVPDGSINYEPLLSLWGRAINWRKSSTSMSKDEILTCLLCELMKPEFEANSLSPEDARILRLRSVSLPSTLIQRILDTIWLPYKMIDRQLEHNELKLLAQLFKTWMQIAQGYSLGFGNTPSVDQIDCAQKFVIDLAGYIVANSNAYPGIRAIIRRHARKLSIEIPEPDSLAAAVFYVPEEDDFDWRERMTRFEEILQQEVLHGLEQPPVFIKRLAQLRSHIADWDQPLTDPLHTIFRLASKSNMELLPMLLAAKEHGLFPEAGPLVGAALAQAEVEDVILDSLMEDETVRQFVVGYALAGRDGIAARYLERIIPQLRRYDVLEVYISLSNPSSQAIAKRLLQHDDKGLRAHAAAAIILSIDATGQSAESAPSEELAELVRNAIKELELPLQLGRRGSDSFLECLASYDPDLYEYLFAQAIERFPGREIYKALSTFESTAPMLSAAAKTRLLTTCPSGTPMMRHVLGVLRGNDIEWLNSILDAKLVDAEMVDSTFNGLGSHVSIESLAALLVPRGIDPMAVAAKIELGTQWGEEHERLEGYVQRMRELAQSSDPTLAAVGTAGLDRYEPMVKAARQKFRARQVSGRL